MARRVSWINNSSGHSGTYVYRAPTLDPQNLPAPVATVDPVAQGATAEWVDNSGEFGCFAVQDYDGQGVGALSTEVCVEEPAPDYASAQIGDEIGGGIYAGIDTIDGTDYHIVSGDAASEAVDIAWKTTNTETVGAGSASDGLSNTQAMQTAGITLHPAAEHCVNYTGGGNTDWHMPAINQLSLMSDNLGNHPEFTANAGSGDRTWSSTEVAVGTVEYLRFSDGYSDWHNGKTSMLRVRPIRRVAV